MVVISFQFEAPIEATPVSSEETQSKLDEFRQMEWLEPDYKETTLIGLEVLERYWHRYCADLKVDYKTALLSEAPATYISFIDWVASNSREKKKQTYDQYWRRLCQYFALLGKRQMNGNVMQQVRRYIKTRLRADHRVDVRPKAKHTMSPQDLGILLRQLWLYGKLTPLGRHPLQQAVILLFSSITGTRPHILVPPKLGGTERERRTLQDLQSDIPKYVRYDDLPRAICYGDIDLFVIRDPDGGSDVVVAVVDFRNLKGTEQGAEGTKFMMHCDYQLVYCPITYILALGEADRAFKNERLTAEYILRLRVPQRLHTLPIPWKEDMLRVPLLRHIENTPYGMRAHPTEPMRYDTSNTSLKALGKDAGYEIPIDHYAFRRWTANESNRAFTDQERNRILGHSGTRIFEKFYNDHFIHRDVQSVVLLRPPQAELCRAVTPMNRKRDPNAPKDFTDEQRQMLCRDPHLLSLREERATLRREMCFGGRPLASAHGTEAFRRHSELGKAITRRRQELRRKGWNVVKNTYHATMPVLEIDKQIDAMMGVESDDLTAVEFEDDWAPPPRPHFGVKSMNAYRMHSSGPLPKHWMALMPSVGAFRSSKTSLLCEIDSYGVDGIPSPKPEDPVPAIDMAFPTDERMFCAGDTSLRTFRPRKKQRPDALRRHVEDQHLKRFSANASVACPHEFCHENHIPPCQTVCHG